MPACDLIATPPCLAGLSGLRFSFGGGGGKRGWRSVWREVLESIFPKVDQVYEG